MPYDDYNMIRAYPLLSDPVVLEKGTGAWATFPIPVEIVPAGGIGETFEIVYLLISDVGPHGNYSLVLYQGSVGAEELLGSWVFTEDMLITQRGTVRVSMRRMDVGTRISAAMSSSNSGRDSIGIKIGYGTA